LAGSDGADVGLHRLVFDTGGYLGATGSPRFFEEVVVTFRVADEEHLHVPLLLSPFGYSVYRGS
jgi:5-hydroxyisourate hydrolase